MAITLFLTDLTRLGDLGLRRDKISLMGDSFDVMNAGATKLSQKKKIAKKEINSFMTRIFIKTFAERKTDLSNILVFITV